MKITFPIEENDYLKHSLFYADDFFFFFNISLIFKTFVSGFYFGIV